MEVTTRKVTIVARLADNYEFISNSQDVQPILEDLGMVDSGYDALFVKIGDGEYLEVWGIVGIVPYLSKLATQLL